jgi:hypothetical protein
MTIDPARATLGLVHRARSVCGWVRTCLLVPFLAVWLTFPVNSPHDLPFNLFRWREHFEYGVHDRYEQQWPLGKEIWGVKIEYTGGRYL